MQSPGTDAGGEPGPACGIRIEPTPIHGRWAALIACALLGLWWALSVSDQNAWGWDESMHAELPAARMALFAGEGSFGRAADELLDCQQYPFGYPLYLAAVQLVFGVDEGVARAASRCLWALGCYGLFLLGAELARKLREARGGRPGRNDDLIPWLALAIGATSPLALSFSGLLFLEMGVVTATIFALRAWLRRGRLEPRRRELVAGAWLMVVFFTKFNYGVLLGFALFLDLVIETVGDLRAGRGRCILQRTGRLALVPALGFAWWFLWPLPAGLEMGAAHRQAFWDYLHTNENIATTPYARRLLEWSCYLVYAPRVLGILLIALAATLGVAWRAGPRALWLVLLGLGLPILLHPFHLERFLLPGLVPLAALGALGLSRLAPRSSRARLVALVGLLVAAFAFPALDSQAVIRRLYPDTSPDNYDYQNRMLADWRSLDPAKPLPTNGLERGASEQLLDLIMAELGEQESPGWLFPDGMFSPGALHLGVLARGGSPWRFLRWAGQIRPRDGEPAIVITFRAEAPEGWDEERVLSWAGQFELVFHTSPVQFRGRPNEPFHEVFPRVLVDRGGWSSRVLGVVDVPRPNNEPVPVTLIALRPPSAAGPGDERDGR